MASLPQLTRAQLSKAFNGDQAIIRVFEALLGSVQFAPEAIEQAQATADQAIANAAAAQGTANAAGAAAAAAQQDTNTLRDVPFVTIGTSTVTPNERALVEGQGIAIVDSGPGNPVTVRTSDIIAILPSDVSDATASFVNATGLALTLVPGATYIVDALVTFQSAAVTTGLALGFTLPAGAVISGMYQHNTTATALEGSYNIASGAVKGNTSAVLVATENVPVQGRWIIKADVTPGSAQLQFRTEVAASAVTLKASVSALIARRIA